MTSNRIRLVYVTFELWLDSLMNDSAVRCVNLPREAKVERAMPCTDRMGRDAVIWLSSPDFDEVAEGEVIPEFRLKFELLRDDPIVTAMADALREASYHVLALEPHTLQKVRDAIKAHDATFYKGEL